jgi:hypothetical protein
MIIIDLGPGYGVQIGKTRVRTNSLNISILKDPWMISQAMKLSTVYTGRMDHRSDLLIDLYSCGVTPTGAQPYFRSPVRSFAADSSRNSNCFASHVES